MADAVTANFASNDDAWFLLGAPCCFPNLVNEHSSIQLAHCKLPCNENNPKHWEKNSFFSRLNSCRYHFHQKHLDNVWNWVATNVSTSTVISIISTSMMIGSEKMMVIVAVVMMMTVIMRMKIMLWWWTCSSGVVSWNQQINLACSSHRPHLDHCHLRRWSLWWRCEGWEW